jgi:hypothetical protein
VAHFANKTPLSSVFLTPPVPTLVPKSSKHMAMAAAPDHGRIPAPSTSPTTRSPTITMTTGLAAGALAPGIPITTTTISEIRSCGSSWRSYPRGRISSSTASATTTATGTATLSSRQVSIFFQFCIFRAKCGRPDTAENFGDFGRCVVKAM